MNSRMGSIKMATTVISRIIATIAIIGLTMAQPAPFASAQGTQPGITSPATGSSIAGNVPVFGTAVIEPFQKYELHYKLEPSGDDAYIYFDGSTSPIVNGQLGVWMSEGLPPGTYSLRLRVVKQDGNYAEYFAPNLSVNQGPRPTDTPDPDAEPTETPIPTATFTPAPQPTAVVGQVQQPILELKPTPTQSAPSADQTGAGVQESVAVANAGNAAPSDALAAGSSTTREIGAALSLPHLRVQFLSGVRMSAALILVIVALYASKKLFSWVWNQFT